MTELDKVYLKTAELLLVIFIGYAMKRCGKLTAKDTQTFSRIVLNITLPSVVIKNLWDISFDQDLLWAIIFGFAANALLLLAAFLLYRRQDQQKWLAALFSITTFNIGNFAVPVLSSFISAKAMAGVLAFNLPACIFTYAIVPSCSMLAEQGNSWKTSAKKILHSVPTMTCLLMFLLAAVHLTLPQPVYHIASSFANANTFLAMLSVGSLMDFSVPKAFLSETLPHIGTRFVLAGVLAASVFMLPIGADLRSALIISLFVPAASSCPVFAMQAGYRGGAVSVANSVYLLISVFMLALLSVLLY